MPEYKLLLLRPFDPDGTPSATVTESGPFFSREAAERAATAALGTGKFVSAQIVGG